MSTRVPIGPFLNGQVPEAIEDPSADWTVVEAFPNLSVDDPVCLEPEPGTNRLYVCGRQGTIHWFVNDPATSTKTLFLDLTAVTQGYDDCGLMGMAFHPEYRQPGSTNRGFVYVYYQYSPSPVAGPNRPPSATPGYNRLSRFTVPDGSLVADRDSELILINQFDRHVWHNGGGMFFGDDGFLYLSNGDEGAANDSYGQTQQMDSGLFSGVLRIDVDSDPTKSHPILRQPKNGGSLPSGWTLNSFTANYYIPNDNPFYTNSVLNPDGTNILAEFWAVGLRSPHRMTFDPVSKQIWVGDVGQGSWEEVDLIQKGGNYQWAYREGDHNGPKAMPSPLIGIDTPPIHDYVHANGDRCVIGGFIYRGTQWASELGGKYIFGDNGSGRIWSMSYDGVNAPTVTYLANMPSGQNYQGLSSFGVDQNNELYMCKMGRPSKIYKLARTGPPLPPPPALLSQTGAFADVTTLTPAAGVIPYTVNSPLWSDGAVKTRWLAVPNDGAPYGPAETIGFLATNEWSFPVGTVLIKHFALPVDDTDPSVLRRLETRLLVHDTNEVVYGITYKWRSDNSDADLLATSLLEDIPVQTSTGERTQSWFYPGRQDCLTCHTPNANHVLGVKTRHLNGNFTYPSTGIADNQLRTLNHLGLFDIPLNEGNIPNYDKTVHVTDTSATLEDRVKSYLDANCAHCHRPGGAQAFFDARYDTPMDAQAIIDGLVSDPFGIIGAREVKPQDLSKSIMYLRMDSVDGIKMPPLAKSVVDTNAVNTLAEWIMTLPLAPGLPVPWDHQDVGNVGFLGDATYNTNSGTYTVSGSGSDIWNTSDGFHYMFQPRSGDVTMVARVSGVQNTDNWAKAGVMFRESLDANSRHAMMVVTPGQGTAFQRRTGTGSSSSHTAGSGVTAPYWVRLVREGNTFTGYESSDGNNWTQVGSSSISISGSYYVGLAVTAHNNNALCAATFTDVSVTGPGGNSAPTITSLSNQVIDEDTLLDSLSVTVGDVETPAGLLSVTGSSTDQNLVPDGQILISANGSSRSVTIMPGADQSGSATITLSVTDGQTNSTTSFLLTVNPVNDPPQAVDDMLAHHPDRSVKTWLSGLLENDWDTEGDTLMLIEVGSPSAAGGEAMKLGQWVRYVPPPGLLTNDIFTYTVSDGNGGTNTGTVTVELELDLASTPNLTVEDLGGGSYLVRFRGVPGRSYRVQYTENLQSPVWQTLGTVAVDGTGRAEFNDNVPMGAPERFYRTINP